MIFQLQLTNGKILAVADKPASLDFSLLHKAKKWQIAIAEGAILASVDWQPASTYGIYLNSKLVDHVDCHSRIIPIIQAVMEVWGWEQRFDSKIVITPLEN